MGHVATLVCMDCMEMLESPACTEDMETQVSMEDMETQVSQGCPVIQVNRDRPEHVALVDLRVQITRYM